MIEITKQNENYQISDTAENGWSMMGTASKESGGSININFSVSDPSGLEDNQAIGNCSYSKYDSSDRVSLSYDVDEANRDEFATYVDTVVDAVLAHFSE